MVDHALLHLVVEVEAADLAEVPLDGVVVLLVAEVDLDLAIVRVGRGHARGAGGLGLGGMSWGMSYRKYF